MDKEFIAVQIYGLIGYPVKHSFSPAMHNAAFKYLNINAEYRLFEVPPERLEEFLLNPNAKFEDIDGNSIPAGDVLGFNITIPYKVKAREILKKEFPLNEDLRQMLHDSDTPQKLQDSYYVRLSGAINTVIKGEKGTNYYNTDASGFLKSLTKKELLCLHFEPKGKNVLIIGCGGAGRAIIASLSWKNVGVKNIYINDINDEVINSAKEYFAQIAQIPYFSHLKEILKFVSTKDIAEAVNDCQLLINASPVGMEEGDGSVVDKSLLHKNLSVYDVVYNRKTQLIQDAKSSGLPAVNGLGMLLYQGVDAFDFWTGKKAPVEIMRKALMEALYK